MSADGKAGPALYEIDALSFSVAGREIVHRLDLRLAAGKVYGLVGPNGSGKSTLLRMLARQERPTSGTLRHLGRDAAEMGEREFARSVAYMPQFTPPAEGMTVDELVSLGRFPWHGALGRFGEADRCKVEAAIKATGLEGLRGRVVDSLSGGERQRAWLAMMVAQDTQCLLLDEPTSALDIAQQMEMLMLVQRLNAASGISAIIVLHDINMAARLCDEILALRDGRLIARGAPGEVMNGAVLADIYGVEMGILAHPTTGAPLGYVR